MKWILNLLYACLLLALSPVIIWRSVRHGRYRNGLPEKLFGKLPQFSKKDKVVWFHAVSVGEVLQLEKLIESLQKSASDKPQILISTSTDTGYELASKRFPDCKVTWFPLDFSWAVSNAISRVNPALFVLVELELWPNFLAECRHQNITTALVNARMSDRSFSGYSKIHSIVSPLFCAFDVVAAQNHEYAERILALGARPESTTVTGSIKFDGVGCDRNNSCTEELRKLFQLEHHEQVFIAGSTQAPEEQMALNAFREARDSFPNLRLILVPRHRERFDEVADTVTTNGFNCLRKSHVKSETVTKTAPVIVLDTIGDLSACWGLADVAFVGGSFGSRGGQNMLEPAAFGAAVMFGPKTRNFRDIVRQLLAAKAAIELQTEDDMRRELIQLLKSPQKCQLLGQRSREVIQREQGAITRTTALLCAALKPGQQESDQPTQDTVAA